MPKQHLPILKICSCPCQAGPKALREFFVSRCRRGVWGTEKLIDKLKDFIAKVKAATAETSGVGSAGMADERRDQKR